jgi:hypothetical protein
MMLEGGHAPFLRRFVFAGRERVLGQQESGFSLAGFRFRGTFRQLLWSEREERRQGLR